MSQNTFFRFKKITFGCAIFLGIHLNAQEFSTGINVDSPNPNAVLHLVSPNGDQGLLIPKLTTVQRLAMSLDADDVGLMVYDEVDGNFFFWNGASWTKISTNLAQVLSVGNDAGNVTITNVADPVNEQDVATKNYVDNQADSDEQQIDAFTLTGTTLEISLQNDGVPNESVDLATIDTDDQTLSLAGTDLTIEGGNSVDIASGFGSAAGLDVGTGANQIVQLDALSRLPNVDGSQLTNLNFTEVGDIESVVAGTGLTGGATTGDATLNVDVGIGANQIVQLDASSRLPNVDGSQLTNLTFVEVGDIESVVAGTGLTGGATTGDATLNVDVGTGADQIVQLDALSRLPNVDGSQLTNLNFTEVGDIESVVAGTGLTGGATAGDATLNVDVGIGANQIVQLDASSRLPNVDGSQLTNLTFVEVGDIESVVAGTGLTGGATAGDATLNVNVGTGANQIVQLDASSRLPNVDGSQLMNINFTEVGDIESVVAGTGLTGGATEGDATLNVNVGTGPNQIVRLNASSQLPNVDGSQLTNLNETGDIESVVAGTGLTGGATAGDATLNVNVGTGANQIVQLDASSRLPNVDGSQLTNLTETGDIESVVAGTGLTGGATAGDATLNVNVGTGPNQIVQLDASSRLPNVDGSQLTNISFTEVGDIESVVAGTGLTGGATAGDATLNVNVGTGANQIVQLDASSRLPNVDGSQLMNINFTEVGDIESVVAGTGLTGGATAGDATLNVNAGTGPNQIVQLDASSRLPNVDGSQLTNISFTEVGDIESVVAGTGLTGGAVTGAATLNVDVGTSANQIVQLNASSQLPNVDGSQLTNLNETGDIESVVAGTGLTGGATAGDATLNVDAGTGPNQIVQLNASSQLPNVDGSQLTNLTETGDIESVVAGTGLTGGATAGDATLTVDVGTGANQIVQLDASSRLPNVDGSQLMNINFTEVGDIESVVAGTGLTGGATAGDATLNVNVGTGANQIVQLDASSRLPNVDGSQLTNISFTEVGDIESVVAGTGLTGGAVTGAATLNVDVGTGPNQIVQLNASSQLPNVDGSQLTNLNETGDIESVVAGTGLTGGATAGDATLNVDAGTGPNQIVQLNASSQLPNVDGSQLTNLTETGDIESVVAGTGLTGGATAGDATLTVDVGTGANQIVQLDASSRLPNVDGSQLTNINFTEVGDIESVVAGTGLTGGATAGDATLNVNAGTGPNQIVQLDASSRLPNVDGSQLTNINFTEVGDIESVVAGTGLTGGAVAGAATLNVDVGTSANQIVQLNASSQLPNVDGSQLTNLTETGDIESVVAGTGLTGGATAGDATLNVNVGTGANQIVQLDASSRLPNVDGSQLTNISFTEVGDIESVVAGTGLTGGSVTGAATLNVDVGTGPNQIVQLNASSQLPNVDGSQLTNINFTEVGDIESVIAGTGLTGGAVTGAATLNVNAGTGPNQIVQLDASSRLPNVDGSQLTNINFTEVGDIESVVAGTGLTGGATAGDATLNVDVGTAANQIVQLNASGELPAVDGSNLTGISITPTTTTLDANNFDASAVGDVVFLQRENTGDQLYSNINNGATGQQITFISIELGVAFADEFILGGNVVLGNRDIRPLEPGASLTLRFDGTFWYEVAGTYAHRYKALQPYNGTISVTLDDIGTNNGVFEDIIHIESGATGTITIPAANPDATNGIVWGREITVITESTSTVTVTGSGLSFITEGGSVSSFPMSYTNGSTYAATFVYRGGSTWVVSNQSILNGSGSYNPASVAITGGTIDGAAIGQSTAADGTFDNFEVTGTFTLPNLSIETTMLANNAATDAKVANNLTISGGNINNTAIGQSTAANGRFAVLEATGNSILAGAQFSGRTFINNVTNHAVYDVVNDVSLVDNSVTPTANIITLNFSANITLNEWFNASEVGDGAILTVVNTNPGTGVTFNHLAIPIQHPAGGDYTLTPNQTIEMIFLSGNWYIKD